MDLAPACLQTPQFRVEGRAAVLIDPVNTAFVGLQDPARAAAPPKADLALRYLIGRYFLIQEGTPFGITIFQPLLPVNVLIGRYIRTGNDTSAIVLRNSLFCHDEKPLSYTKYCMIFCCTLSDNIW